MAAKITLEVVKKEHVTQYVYFVTFKLINPPTIDFKSGQNMMLMIAPGVNRTMSIASPPNNNNELLMVHDIAPMGPGSKWTLDLNVGDSATIVAPTGGALSFLDTPRKKIMVATGTGIAPFHGIILDKLSVVSRQPSDAINKNILKADDRPLMTLYWGVRFEQDRYWGEEFDRLAKEHSNFTWHQILSKPTANWKGLTGHVTEHVLSTETDLHNSEFYLCGIRAMIDEMVEKLTAQNVPKAQIKTELFY